MHNVNTVIPLFTLFLLLHLLVVPPPLPLCSAALARWFSLGLLQLQQITWEHSPGQLLQRLWHVSSQLPMLYHSKCLLCVLCGAWLRPVR